MNAQNARLPLKADEHLGRLTIREILGRGENAEVYRAFHPDYKRDVALKVFRTVPEQPETLRECFRQQMRAIMALKHPNIIRVLEADMSEEGWFYIVMELFEAVTTLRDAISLHPAGFEREEGLRLFRQIASAVAYAHEQGIVHGNIKPDNVLLPSPTRPLLTDFDIACFREHQVRRRTPNVAAYLAPEQILHQEAGERSDIYTLGLLLYEMMVGDVPFKGNTFDAIADLQVNAPPTPPTQIRVDLDVAVEQTIVGALRKKPAARFGSVREMLESLEGNTTANNPYETLTLERSQIFRSTTQERNFERERAADAPLVASEAVEVVRQRFPRAWWIALASVALLLVVLIVLLVR